MSDNYVSSGRFVKDCESMLPNAARMEPAEYFGLSELAVDLDANTQKELAALLGVIERGEMVEFSDLEWSDFYAASTEFELHELQEFFVLHTAKRRNSLAALLDGSVELYSTGGEPAILLTAKGVYSYYTDPDLQKIAPNIGTFLHLLVRREAALADDSLTARFTRDLRRACKKWKDTVWQELAPKRASAPAPTSAFHPFDPSGLVFGLTGESSHFDKKAFARRLRKIGGKLGDEYDIDLDVLVVGIPKGKFTSVHSRARALVDAGVWEMKIVTDAEFALLGA